MAEILSERKGLQRVRLEDGGRAYNLTQLTPIVRAGDRVVCNVTAVELGLGTGGWHVVHWNLDAADDVELPGGGHIMKLRYTSLQSDTGVFEEHETGTVPDDLDGIPVMACSLHSQMAVAAIAFAATAPTGARLAYVMTDGAALPLPLSDLVEELTSAKIVAATITAGHAFGGDHEAVNVASALTIARHACRADAIVVSMGPGVVGTGTKLGTTAVEVAEIVHAARSLRGSPLVAARASSADPRSRHAGVSHHTITALELAGRPVAVPLMAEDVALAESFPADVTTIETQMPSTKADSWMTVEELLDRQGIAVTTMGRRSRDDPLFFRCAAATGIEAGRQVGARA